MLISCRKCQKARSCQATQLCVYLTDLMQGDHLPKSCEEHAEDLKKNNIHRVEEAMSAAYIRNCPKCKIQFDKIGGVRSVPLAMMFLAEEASGSATL